MANGNKRIYTFCITVKCHSVLAEQFRVHALHPLNLTIPMPQCCNPSYSRSPPLTYLAQASRKQDVAINGNSQSPPHGLWPGTTSGSHIALEKQASECKCGSPDTSKLSISVLFHSKCPNLMFEPTGHEYFPLSTKKYY